MVAASWERQSLTLAAIVQLGPSNIPAPFSIATGLVGGKKIAKIIFKFEDRHTLPEGRHGLRKIW